MSVSENIACAVKALGARGSFDSAQVHYSCPRIVLKERVAPCFSDSPGEHRIPSNGAFEATYAA